jgi:hypothetical protein
VFELNARQFDGFQWFVSTLLLVTYCAALPGCGGSKLPRGAIKKAPISGTVTMGGKALEGAEVYFYTEKFTGFAKTDEEGKYTLAQGAAIGANKVYFSKIPGGAAAAVANDPTLTLDDPTQTEIANQTQAESGKKGPKQLIPPEYNAEKTTKLTFDVQEGGATDADFNL